MTSKLINHCVLNTRAKEQASELTARLESWGAQVLEHPTLEIVPLDIWDEFHEAVREHSRNDWLVFTSANGARVLEQHLKSCSDEYIKDRLKLLPTAVIGQATAAVARSLGFQTEFVASTAQSETFAAEFVDYLEANDSLGFPPTRLLLVQGKVTSGKLVQLLERPELEVVPLAVYDSVRSKADEGQIERLLGGLGCLPEQGPKLDMLTFTSSQAAYNFMQTLEQQSLVRREEWLDRVQSLPVAVIGPKTAKTVKDLGLRFEVVAQRASIQTLVDNIIQYFEDKHITRGGAA